MAYSRPGVYISERLLPAPLTGGVSANAAGAVVAPFAQGPEAVTLVSSWYEFTKNFGGYNASYPATFQVGAFFANGGRELYVKRLLANDADVASVDLETSGSAVVATITSKNAGTDGNNLRVVVSAGSVASTYTVTLYKESGVVGQIGDDILLERYENIVFDDDTSSDYAETVINLVSPNITVSNSAAGVPVYTTYPLTGGDNGTAPIATDYTDYKASGSVVFEDFASLDRPLVFFLPGVAGIADDIDVLDAATSWSESNNGFVVVDTEADQTVANAISFAASLADSSNAAVYYPNLYIADPLGRGNGALRKIGPAGSVAGLYLATDAARGVFKAPAGIGSALQGVVAVEKAFSSTDLDTMNSSTSPVNPIRQIPGAGLSVMGARTLKQDGTANKYVNMRRSLIYIRKNLKNLTEFAIFENNDERLWTQIRTSINVFLGEYRNQGGLRGASASQAFFVKCDAENNSAQQIANGEVHIQVGVALQYPAEFIVIDLSQKTLN
ncbi:Phage tail sheath C-terminal domain containing protein [uncultured Caudovirales phage]|uniref:Phage tail sheath C-terminal domain containing protein n=1 Tax=uncultured Caudovirales phage TaxID=2100421 RepID=A0A6J5T1I1_9CAUD|nr:Phage tail sheath C-terminal domain containing protein [uncultured Caudovirales phage]CAB4220547.1 Phage tail sheath C-terminal domain containing protein [uncultured Caudovirales phage]